MQFMRSALAAAISVLALAACDQLPGGAAEAPEATAEATTEAASAPAVEAYVGTWAVDAAGCNIPQELQGAPYVFHGDGFDQHEAHCTWANVQNVSANVWRIDAACQIEGDEASMRWDISVDGDTMQMDPGGRLVRCPSN
jgi:hypothetical protein